MHIAWSRPLYWLHAFHKFLRFFETVLFCPPPSSLLPLPSSSLCGRNGFHFHHSCTCFWQTVISLMDRIQKAILLSGTPSPTRPLDLHPQASALRPNVFAKDRVKFSDDYCKKRKTRLVQGGVCRRPHELHLLLTRSIMIRSDPPHLSNRLGREFIFRFSMSRSFQADD